MCSPQNNQRANPEPLGDPQDYRLSVISIPQLQEFFAGNERLRRDSIAKGFTFFATSRRFVCIGNRALPDPDMSQFVNESKNLRRLEVVRIDEYERSSRVRNRKALYLFTRNFSSCSIANYAGAHYQHSNFLCVSAQGTKVFA